MKNKKEYVAGYWKNIGDNKVKCLLCPRECVLKEGQRGFCFIRQNINGKLISTAYGLTSGFCVDPIEKKPLNHFYPGTTVFSFGTIGCNLGCKFCQNWQISQAHNMDFLCEEALPQKIAKYAKDNGCKSVAFTYNDPVITAEYVIDTSKACHEIGIKTVAVTSGYISEIARKDFFEHIDAVNVDLKGFTEEFYRYFTLAELKPVLDTLIFIKKRTNVWLEVTNLLIPDENDSIQEINNMCDWFLDNLGKDVPLHFSAFYPAYKMTNYKTTPIKTVLEARNIALSKGIRYVFGGNIYDTESSSTYCHVCGTKLIGRKGFSITEYNLVNINKCPNCQTGCAGFFE